MTEWLIIFALLMNRDLQTAYEHPYSILAHAFVTRVFFYYYYSSRKQAENEWILSRVPSVCIYHILVW